MGQVRENGIRADEKEKNFMEKGQETIKKFSTEEGPAILEEIEVEDLFIDGICGVY
jgi:mycofactocin precursor